MPPIRLGLVGFGRVARSLFRLLAGREDFELAVIADQVEPKAVEYLLRFDTLLGRYSGPLALDGDTLRSGERSVRLLPTDKPGQIPWGELGVDFVVEATTRAETRVELEAHLAAGARRIVVCSPPADPPDLMLLPTLNAEALRAEHRILSNGPATLHCAVPVIQVLEEAFGIERLFLTSVHAYSDQQRLADVPEKDMRRGRAAAENIVPMESQAGRLLEELMPALAGKVVASAVHVPVANGSLVDLVLWHSRPVTVEAINAAVREAAPQERFAGVLAYETEPIVSSDVLGSSFSSTFDSDATLVLGERLSKTLAWFDNGWSYTHRLLGLLERLARIDRRQA